MSKQEIAAKSLYEKLKDKSWFTSVGRARLNGEYVLFIYISSIATVEYVFPKIWEGFPVLIRGMSTPEALVGVI